MIASLFAWKSNYAISHSADLSCAVRAAAVPTTNARLQLVFAPFLLLGRDVSEHALEPPQRLLAHLVVRDDAVAHEPQPGLAPELLEPLRRAPQAVEVEPAH